MDGISLMDYLPDPNTVKGGIGEVLEILQIEAPLVVDEIIRWHVFKNIIPFVLCLMLLILMWSLVYKKRKWIWDKQGGNYSDENRFMPVMITVCCVTCVLGTIIGLSLGWLMPLIAPRLFLLEYIKDLLT